MNTFCTVPLAFECFVNVSRSVLFLNLEVLSKLRICWKLLVLTSVKPFTNREFLQQQMSTLLHGVNGLCCSQAVFASRKRQSIVRKKKHKGDIKPKTQRQVRKERKWGTDWMLLRSSRHMLGKIRWGWRSKGKGNLKVMPDKSGSLRAFRRGTYVTVRAAARTRDWMQGTHAEQQSALVQDRGCGRSPRHWLSDLMSCKTKQRPKQLPGTPVQAMKINAFTGQKDVCLSPFLYVVL